MDYRKLNHTTRNAACMNSIVCLLVIQESEETTKLWIVYEAISSRLNLRKIDASLNVMEEYKETSDPTIRDKTSATLPNFPIILTFREDPHPSPPFNVAHMPRTIVH